MVDLETWGTGPRAVIASIGAVRFENGKISTGGFYTRVDPQSCIDKVMAMRWSKHQKGT